MKKHHQVDKDHPEQFFTPLPKQKEGMWLFEQPESGQDFDKFCADRRCVIGQNGDQISIIPMRFDNNTQITKRLLEDISKFVKAFYFGSKVKVQKPEKLSDIRKSGKVRVFS